ncbi:dihydroorotate dehydrogenase [Constrictibacter sp. MBR-5]|jgi:dihydroorotate dehydrogenase|uniref:quinone-dependent dihydroorotate dehydrogenase n=1 Tax=Constrictibacter sp. MBR-5 TaxID=3156467 RepID=UPI00339935AC
MNLSTSRALVRLAALLPPETAHRLALRALASGLLPRDTTPDDPVMAVELFGRRFRNPVGIAAGFDKHAEAIAGMLAQGAGFVEIGGVTPLPQPGNPRPRLFRLAEDRAVINRMGFNSEGSAAVVERLARFRRDDPAATGIVGVNIGMNKETRDPAADFAHGVRVFAPHADFLVINVSSPNTPGLRSLQGRAALSSLLGRVGEALGEAVSARAPALLVKVAPDLDEAGVADVAEVLLDLRRPAGALLVQGLIVGNTTIARPDGLRSPHRKQAGGLSGRPLFDLSTQVLARFHGALGGAMPLVGVGGISSGADAYAKIRAGATLVQLYSALVYDGPALIGRIRRDLAALLKADGFTSVAEAVGTAAVRPV